METSHPSAPPDSATSEVMPGGLGPPQGKPEPPAHRRAVEQHVGTVAEAGTVGGSCLPHR